MDMKSLLLISAFTTLVGCQEQQPTTPESIMKKACYNKGFEARHVNLGLRPDKDLLRFYEGEVKGLLSKRPDLFQLCKDAEYEGWEWAKKLNAPRHGVF